MQVGRISFRGERRRASTFPQEVKNENQRKQSRCLLLGKEGLAPCISWQGGFLLVREGGGGPPWVVSRRRPFFHCHEGKKAGGRRPLSLLSLNRKGEDEPSLPREEKEKRHTPKGNREMHHLIELRRKERRAIRLSAERGKGAKRSA